MHAVLTYLDRIDALLCSLPTRAQIMGDPKLDTERTIKIRVDRTMPFEYIAKMIPSFCGLWRTHADFDYSDYDTALTDLGGDLQADVYLIWLDWRIYSKMMSPQQAVNWLTERIQQLRGQTDKPIWVNNCLESQGDGDMLFSLRAGNRGWIRQLNSGLSELIQHNSRCELIDLVGLAYEGSESFYDHRNDEISNYPLSDQATIKIARHLGVHLLPAAFGPRLKAIALDLDDTLYNGVLGEAGVEGVTLTEGHYRLQKLLLRLKESGILLTVCSRNEELDVEALFNGREDFPLKMDDFAAVSANWQPKADNLLKLAKQLNINSSSFLFVDDNPAELLKMAAALPDVQLLRANHRGKETMIRICHYPGLYQLHQDEGAASRTTDIQANQKREKIRQEALDNNMYLGSLKMVVKMYENEPSHTTRLFDLSAKTNQFNLALRRMSEIEAKEVMDKESYLTITVGLSDLLSDSGIVGAFVCRLEGDNARLIETIFSCRALGREIETVSFVWVLEKLIALGIEQLRIDHVKGPRNAPAVSWLKRYAGDDESYSILALHSRVKAACSQHPAKVEVIK